MNNHRNCDSLKTLLIVTIYISALSFFALQVWDVCIKYFAKKTTVATSGKILDEIQVPIITICSGYKITSNMSSEVLSFQDIEPGPSLFEKSTYKLGRDFGANLSLMLGTELIMGSLEVGQNTLTFGNETIINVTVREITSLKRGLCYAITVEKHFQLETDFLDLSMYYSEELALMDTKVGFEAFLSNKNTDAGVIYEVWHGLNDIFIDMKLHVRFKVGLTLTSNFRLEEENSCLAYGESGQYESKSQCYMDNLMDAGSATIMTTCPNPCIVPVAESALKNGTKWNKCLTPSDAACFAKAMFAVAYDATVIRDCLQPCIDLEFKSNIKTEKGQHTAGLFVYFDSMTLVINEQVLLFDVSAFIGNIGGSLGLFVGFSYLDFATKIVSTLIDCLRFKRK